MNRVYGNFHVLGSKFEQFSAFGLVILHNVL